MKKSRAMATIVLSFLDTIKVTVHKVSQQVETSGSSAQTFAFFRLKALSQLYPCMLPAGHL